MCGVLEIVPVISTNFTHTGIPHENLKCLQSLYISNPQDDLAATRSAKGDRVPGTCEWILTQDRYTAFLIEDGPRLLWLSGGPGIGKTMISSFLVEELAHLAERSSQMTLAYYFCDDKDEKRRSATAILRGLLLQLLRQRPVLFKHIQPSFDISRDDLFINFHSLWRVFISVVQDPGVGEVFCLIDALDECEKESRQLLLTNLTKQFGRHENDIQPTKFIITSRRESDIEEELLSADNPRIQDIHIDNGKVNRDLSKFIDFKVDQLSTVKGYRSAQREMIRYALTDKAGGTFLYISLVLHDLKRTKIWLRVTQKLGELPPDLNKVYDRILRSIDDGCEEIAKMVLYWVAVALRPFTIDELAMALALGSRNWKKNTTPPKEFVDESRDCFRCCEPLVYVDTKKNTINLVHQSAKEYLLSTYLREMDGLSRYHTALDRTNLFAFRICWLYLSLDEFKQGTIILQRDKDQCLSFSPMTQEFLSGHCFLSYACKAWGEHALAAGPALATDQEFWKHSLNKMPIFRDHWLLKAAVERQQLVVQQLLEEGAEPNSRDEYSGTPLSWAAVSGDAFIVKLLLSRDDIVADPRDGFRKTPLSRAAERGHEAIVKLLLSRDDVAVDSQDRQGQTPLSHAAKGGHEAIVKLLLSRDDVAVNPQDREGRTPLSYTAEKGHEAIIKLLLNRDDVAINSRDSWGRTPLDWAKMYRRDAVVRLLEDRMSEASSASKKRPTEKFSDDEEIWDRENLG